MIKLLATSSLACALIFGALNSEASDEATTAHHKTHKTVQLLDAPMQSLAPGIKLRSNTWVKRGLTDDAGLPAMDIVEQLRLRAHTANDTMGVCACDTKPDGAYARSHPIGQTSLRDAAGDRFVVSVVNFELALKIFKDMEQRMREPGGFLRDGCHARAHQMAFLLEKRGILTGKAMATGKFQVMSDRLETGAVNWIFHVAPMLVVQEGQRRRVWVLDPTLFAEPVPLESWLAVLVQHPKASLDEVFLTNRFVLHPKFKHEGIASWRPADIKAAKLMLKLSRQKAERERAEREKSTRGKVADSK